VDPTRRERCPHPSFLGETTPVAVKIKLKRMGKIHAPFYRIIVADARTKRDGRAIEEIGKYHPKSEPSFIEVDSERAQHWLSVGAQPTDPVRKILEITGDWQKFKGLPGAEGTLRTAAPKPDKKDAYAAAVAEVHGLGDAAKAKVRKPAGKGDDQADAEAKPVRTAGRSGGKQAAAKTSAKDDTAKADTAKADTAKADTAKADTAKADTAKADTAKADSARDDAAKAAAPEAAAPEAAVPEAAVPEAAVPEAAVPEAAVPEAAVPEAAVPEAAAPEAAAPEAAAADDAQPSESPTGAKANAEQGDGA
jgi:small subunit ribosomal protein S16